MGDTSKASATSVFEIKSTAVSVLALLLKTADVQTLGAAMKQQMGDASGLFENEPVCIDLAALKGSSACPDFQGLVTLLRHFGLNPIAVRSGRREHMAAAAACGLVESPDGHLPVELGSVYGPPIAVAAAVPEVAVEQPPVAPTLAAPVPRTMIVDRPVRSGQRIYARGGDLVLLAVVNAGAEVVADGSIHVYAPLRGGAHAGARGDTHARIFSTCMEPQLVSIAGAYRTTEEVMGKDVTGKMAQIRLEGERLLFEPIKP